MGKRYLRVTCFACPHNAHHKTRSDKTAQEDMNKILSPEYDRIVLLDDPVNFNMLKIFNISCLNLDFVAFSLLVKKSVKNMAKLG